MDLAAILLYGCVGLVVLCLLVMTGYGLRHLLEGPRRSVLTLAAFALAAGVFAVSYAVADPSAYPSAGGEAVTRGEVALTYTGLALFALTALAMLVASVRPLVDR
jgi:hypothetical protein